jgi:hypothetical protein
MPLSAGSNLTGEYLCEFENILGCKSGAKGYSIGEKTEGRKSRDCPFK